MSTNSPGVSDEQLEQDVLIESPQRSPLIDEAAWSGNSSGLIGSPELDDISKVHATSTPINFEEQLSLDSDGSELAPNTQVTTEVPAKYSRRALCIGINAYPVSPLQGCVSDAERWNGWFQGNGFQTEPMLTDAAATREGILDAILRLVSGCAPGDVIAIQYSGHGTQLPDLDGDEEFGDTPGLDEALVPVDHRQNGYIIDDDIGDICNSIPAGANVTFFMDCCHSGTNSRGLFSSRMTALHNDARPRFLQADAEMIAVHLRARAAHPNSRSLTQRSAEDQREISFGACLSSQLAWESNGQGDFTRNALGILQQHGIGEMSHEEFLIKVRDAFPANARQNPLLSCSDQYRQQVLLGTRM